MSPPVDPLADRLADRPAWQVIALAVGIVFGTLFAVVLVVAAGTVTAPYSPLAGHVHLAAVGLPVVLGLYEAVRRWVARAPAAWFLAARPGPAVVGWVGIGLAFPASVLGLELWLLEATLTGGLPPLSAALGALLVSLAAGLLPAVLEELALRGALLRVIEARWGSGVAVVATAAVFAALHQGHAGGPVTLVLVIASMLAAGLFLGVVVVRTRSVWNAVALHAGWNAIFGGALVTAAVPAAGSDPALLQFGLPADATLLTGGTASLGAAPLTTGCLLLAAAAVARAPGPWLRAGRRTAPPRVERAMSWRVVARREAMDLRRSRGFWSLLVLSVVIGVAAVLLPAVAIGDGLAAERALVFLVAPLKLVVVMTGLLAGYSAVAGPRAGGQLKLVLGLPIDRTALVFGAFVGRASIVLAGTAVALGVVLAALLVVHGTIPLRPVLGFGALLGLLAVSITGLAVGLSAASASPRRAVTAAIGSFVLFEFFWGVVPASAHYLIEGSLPGAVVPPWVVLLERLQPLSAFDAATDLVLPAVHEAVRLSPEGAQAAEQAGHRPLADRLAGSPPVYLDPWAGVLTLAGWMIAPLVAGVHRFRRADL